MLTSNNTSIAITKNVDVYDDKHYYFSFKWNISKDFTAKIIGMYLYVKDRVIPNTKELCKIDSGGKMNYFTDAMGII